MIGLLCVLALVGVVVYAGIRLAPVYLNYLKVARSLAGAASDVKGDNPDQRSLMGALAIPPPGVLVRGTVVFAHEFAGQRDLADPRVQQNIRNLLMNRKDTLLRSAYLEVAHSEARVVNYYAQQILTQPAGRK